MFLLTASDMEPGRAGGASGDEGRVPCYDTVRVPCCPHSLSHMISRARTHTGVSGGASGAPAARARRWRRARTGPGVGERLHVCGPRCPRRAPRSRLGVKGERARVGGRWEGKEGG